MTAAREEVLGRIRRALADVSVQEPARDVAVPREYRHEDAGSREELVALLADRVRDYGAGVHQVRIEAVSTTVGQVCATRGSRRLAVPSGLPDAWLPPGLDVVVDEELSPEQVDACDAVVSACRMAIAQTGTLVLDGGPGQGRRMLTLVPDHHICVVRTDQIVGLVPEAMAGLHEAVRQGRPITLISGPSATSDIELKRVQGVHGPRKLDVLIVE